MNNISQVIQTLLPFQNFDSMAAGVIDFKTSTFTSCEFFTTPDEVVKSEGKLYFDLASLTKVLTNSLSYFLHPEIFDEKMKLCLEHRAGLIAWGLLSKHDWKKQIQHYSIKESETLYSDFSALRVLLEFDKKSSVGMWKICKTIWDKDLMYWLELPSHLPTPMTGTRQGIPIYNEVHDPNAYVIGEFCSHAGLFASVQGLCKTLLNYQNKTDFISKIHTQLKGGHDPRFVYGWDRVENPQNTLAGIGCGPYTFGHLGFTGTSIWIDPEKMRGHVILSNGVQQYWYDKAGLNEMRRAIGELAWK